MRKFMIVIAAIAALCLAAGAGHAKQISVKLTQEQVATTCGSLIVNAGGRTGCKKGCGDGKTCGFSCNNKGKDCKGVVVQFTGPTSGPPVNPALQGGIFENQIPGFGAQGPAPTGGSVAPASVQLR